MAVKGDAERRDILLQWITPQIPLIEPESNLAKVAENDSGGEDGGDQRKCNAA